MIRIVLILWDSLIIGNFTNKVKILPLKNKPSNYLKRKINHMNIVFNHIFKKNPNKKLQI